MRNRMIQADIHKSRSLAKVSRDARLAFILIWRSLDDDGRAVFDPRILRFESFPHDDIDDGTYCGWIGELVEAGCLTTYEADGIFYICAGHWHDYQSVPKAKASKLPPYEPVENPEDIPVPDVYGTGTGLSKVSKEKLSEEETSLKKPILHTTEGDEEEGAPVGNRQPLIASAVEDAIKRGSNPSFLRKVFGL